MIPFTCDALLDLDDRYASEKFRKVVYRFDPYKLDWDTAMELCAFVQFIGFRWARQMFMWDAYGVRAYNKLRKHFGSEVQPYVDHNRACVTEADALRVLNRLRDVGYRNGKLPDFVENAVRAARKRKVSREDVCQQFGLTKDQLRRIMFGSRVKKRVGMPIVFA